MRPVALGRKNWFHIGSPQAGPKVAAILSVVESCRRLKVPVRDYFSTILPGSADLPIQRLPDFTPAAWSPSIHRRSNRGSGVEGIASRAIYCANPKVGRQTNRALQRAQTGVA